MSRASKILPAYQRTRPNPMRKPSPNHYRLLSIDPSPAGFGFAIIEGGYRLVEWGVARVWSTNDQEFLARVESRIDRFRPSAVVLLDRSADRRESGVLNRWRLLQPYCTSRYLPVFLVSGSLIKEVFRSTGSTKSQIASAIAEEFPELEGRLPATRKAWMSEGEQMNVFDAVSFIVALRHKSPQSKGSNNASLGRP